MELRSIQKCAQSVEISEPNLHLIKHHKDFLYNPNFWHKFHIIDVYGLKPHRVLKSLIQEASPFDFIPLQYKEENQGASFFARICGNIIENFCSEKLSVKNPYNQNQPFKLVVTLGYTTLSEAKVDISKNVIKVLHKRFNTATGVLNLNNFSKDPELDEFLTFLQPKLFAFVLNLAKSSFKIVAVKLCNNEISSLEPIEILAEQNVTYVDLRNNLLRDLSELQYFKNFHITELLLEGNPLCALYDEYNYVERVTKYCPNIQKLDGFRLRQNGFPSFRRNFICDIAGRGLVDGFLEQYFSTYDSKNLMKLGPMYHKDAIYTLTAELSQEETTAYTAQSRNLYSGRSDILKAISKLNRCEHDPYSFTVDVVKYSEKCCIIVITGVFREVPITNQANLMGFNRCFVLKHNNKNYCILNEQLHIFKASTSQEVGAFKFKKSITELKPNNSSQRAQMVQTLGLITNLTKEWSKVFLEECHYNLRDAIMLFMELYQSDKIPSQGLRL